MFHLAQSRNVPLGGFRAWLGRAETSYIAALNSHACSVILRHVLKMPYLLFCAFSEL